MKNETKLSLQVAKKMAPKAGISQQKRIAVSLRRLSIDQIKDIKLELKELRDELREIKELIRVLRKRAA